MLRLPITTLLLSTLVQVPAANAAGAASPCRPSTLAALGRALQVAHFTPAAAAAAGGGDPDAVIVSSSCRRVSAAASQTRVAVAWNSGEANGKMLALAIVDDASQDVAASYSVFFNESDDMHFAASTLDIADTPMDLAPHAQAFGVDLTNEDLGCGSEHQGPLRMLFVQEGRTLRPVLDEFYLSRSRYLRGVPAHCSADSTPPVVETFRMSLAPGAVGATGWRDLVLTATATRSDHGAGRPPLRVRVPYADQAYSLQPFYRAYDDWSR